MIRSSARLDNLQNMARNPSVVMAPEELGTARQTRHSFSRALVRHAVRDGWIVTTRKWELDEKGKGTAIYSVNFGNEVAELVIFSHVIDEEMRNDRVIAQDWDVTAALVLGHVTDDHLLQLSENVKKQEDGRADSKTLIWSRANRSERFFEYIVECLKAGKQPESQKMSESAYILRSTAFYGNGKFGMKDFDGLGDDHPLATPYRMQMLAAWLMRDFGADLVNHCAKANSDSAASLDPNWRRYLGLGNATGLGMVPYPIRHPQVLDAWVALRELPLTNALQQSWAPDSAELQRLIQLLNRAKTYFSEKVKLETAPYPSGPILSGKLEKILNCALEFQNHSTMLNESVTLPGKRLHEIALADSIELRQIVDSILIELDGSIDAEIEKILICTDRTYLEPDMDIEVLKKIVESVYRWVDNFNFENKKETSKFWFYSQNNQEPRRGLRKRGNSPVTEHPVGVALDVWKLNRDLASCAPGEKVGAFIASHPEHWGIIERIQSVSNLPYAEAHINPLAEDFVPLDLQRFQLAIYGMENFNPQSTDWLRVTLYQGAPIVSDLRNKESKDDWLFMPKPTGVL
jgi:hypothetical protein